MKALISLLLTIGMATPALAQGKIRLVNDSLHLVYWYPGGPLGGTNVGQAYSLGQGGITLTIELWSGTSSTALSRVAVTDFVGQPGVGVWAGLNVTLPTAAGLTFFDIYIYDIAAGSWQVASTTIGWVTGTSGLFTAVSSSTIAYNSLANHNSPANSTWADGTYNMDFLAPDYRGGIGLGMLIPEPSTLALGCLGFTLLLMRGRAERNQDSKLPRAQPIQKL